MADDHAVAFASRMHFRVVLLDIAGLGNGTVPRTLLWAGGLTDKVVKQFVRPVARVYNVDSGPPPRRRPVVI